MSNKLNKLEKLNKTLKPPKELSDVFLPRGSKRQFSFMFIAEMTSMNEPKDWDGKSNYNFNVTKRDEFLQDMMEKYGVGGSYATDIVKARNILRQPTEKEIQKWLPLLLKEIKIIQPKAIIVLGKRTYKKSFKPFVEPSIFPKGIKVCYAFHYGSQVPRKKFERRFREVIKRMRYSE